MSGSTPVSSPYHLNVTAEQELVQLFGVKGLELGALRGLAGGVTATHLRTTRLTDAAFAAVVDGVSDDNPRVRWWCIQVLDHVPDTRAVLVLASALDDPVPRVRRNAAHALGCLACKPEWDGALPTAALERLMQVAAEDPSPKVRREAAVALFCVDKQIGAPQSAGRR
jgi:vesicle coat complex subunit